MMNYNKSEKIVDRIKSQTGLVAVEIGHQSNIPGGGYCLEINGRRVGKRGTLTQIETYADIYIEGFCKGLSEASNK